MGHTNKIPAEAVELYTRFIHGEISRRDFFNGVERFAVAVERRIDGLQIIEHRDVLPVSIPGKKRLVRAAGEPPMVRIGQRGGHRLNW
jgi:hypothetical protein